MVFEPLEFIARLAALKPTPRVHLVRYHGVLAPGAPGRERIVPLPDNAEERAAPCVQKHTPAHAPASKSADSTQTSLATTNSVNQRYYSWAELKRRVFALDVLECLRCQGPIKLLAPIHPPDTTRTFIQCLGLPPGHRPVVRLAALVDLVHRDARSIQRVVLGVSSLMVARSDKEST